MAEQPVCWLLAGAALLDIDSSGRRGVDLPEVKSTYWPHRVNFERLSRSRLDWRLLCPGPMVDEPALGLDRLRISLDVLPVEIPAVARALPDSSLLPVFASLIPMIVPYTDAAALMLASLNRGHAMSAIASGWRCRSACTGESHSRLAGVRRRLRALQALARIPHQPQLVAHAEFRDGAPGELCRTLNVVDRTGADRAEHDVFGGPACHHHSDLVFELFNREQLPVLLGHLHRVAERTAAAWASPATSVTRPPPASP